MQKENSAIVSFSLREGNAEIIWNENQGQKRFCGKTISECLLKAANYFSQKEEENANHAEFNGLSIGENIRVSPPRTPLIIGANKKREGFPSNIIGKEGKILQFDRKTRSNKTVMIEIDGKTFWGSHLELDKK